jgi:hypothetical protein
MAKTIIAHPAQEPQTRIDRGRKLFAEHSGEIIFEAELGIWYVPSQHDGTSCYEVILGRRGESCACADVEHRHQACKHIICATIARAKTRQCAGCGQRFPHREIIEVSEDHESLTWFVGDKLCESCAIGHGVL